MGTKLKTISTGISQSRTGYVTKLRVTTLGVEYGDSYLSLLTLSDSTKQGILDAIALEASNRVAYVEDKFTVFETALDEKVSTIVEDPDSLVNAGLVSFADSKWNLSTLVTGLESTFGSGASNVTEAITTSVNDTFALSTFLTNVASEFGSNAASIGSKLGTYATNDSVGAIAQVQLDVNGRITGWTAVDDSSSGSAFAINADTFSITDSTGSYTPFAIADGNVLFNGKVNFKSNPNIATIGAMNSNILFESDEVVGVEYTTNRVLATFDDDVSHTIVASESFTDSMEFEFKLKETDYTRDYNAYQVFDYFHQDYEIQLEGTDASGTTSILSSILAREDNVSTNVDGLLSTVRQVSPSFEFLNFLTTSGQATADNYPYIMELTQNFVSGVDQNPLDFVYKFEYENGVLRLYEDSNVRWYWDIGTGYTMSVKIKMNPTTSSYVTPVGGCCDLYVYKYQEIASPIDWVSEVQNAINDDSTTIDGGKIVTNEAFVNNLNAVGGITADTITGNELSGIAINGARINGAVIKASYLDLDGELEVLTNYHISVATYNANPSLYSDAVYISADNEYRIPSLSTVRETNKIANASSGAWLYSLIRAYDIANVGHNNKAVKNLPTITASSNSLVWNFKAVFGEGTFIDAESGGILSQVTTTTTNSFRVYIGSEYSSVITVKLTAVPSSEGYSRSLLLVSYGGVTLYNGYTMNAPAKSYNFTVNGLTFRISYPKVHYNTTYSQSGFYTNENYFLNLDLKVELLQGDYTVTSILGNYLLRGYTPTRQTAGYISSNYMKIPSSILINNMI